MDQNAVLLSRLTNILIASLSTLQIILLICEMLGFMEVSWGSTVFKDVTPCMSVDMYYTM